MSKKYVDHELDKNTILRFNQKLEKYLKVSVGNNTNNFSKYNKIHLTDVTEIKFPNKGTNLLQKWNFKCSKKFNGSKIGDFIKLTKTNSPTCHSGATVLPPIGNVFMYIETSSNNSGNDNIFVSWERTDFIQISNLTFFYNRYSILTDESIKSMDRFRTQLLLEN